MERKKREIEELQKRERELLQKHEQIKSDMARVRQQVTKIHSDIPAVLKFLITWIFIVKVAGGRTAATGEAEALRKRSDEQEAEIVRKDEQLREQESKIKSLVDKWESEALQIRENHGRDRAELEEARAKYSALKRKVRAAQNHWQKKEEHYKKENSDLREAFGTTLLGYKEKMSEAYQDRERKVEEELVELKRWVTSLLKGGIFQVSNQLIAGIFFHLQVLRRPAKPDKRPSLREALQRRGEQQAVRLVVAQHQELAGLGQGFRRRRQGSQGTAQKAAAPQPEYPFLNLLFDGTHTAYVDSFLPLNTL